LVGGVESELRAVEFGVTPGLLRCARNDDWARGAGSAHKHAPDYQKFFASFFQKRSAFLLSLPLHFALALRCTMRLTFM
jgi:hypothetical protein